MGKKGAATQEKTRKKESVEIIDLDSPHLFFNRELSALKFNERVLEEAEDEGHPLLERVKFLAIFANNLDEFFMIRVSGLRKQLMAGALEAPPDGMSPAEQLAAIRRQLRPLLRRHEECWRYDVLPKLKGEGISVLRYDELKGKQRKLLRRHFKQEIFPALTPLAFDPGHPFPHISNLSLNLAVVVTDPVKGQQFARLKVPALFPRLLPIPLEDDADTYGQLGLHDLVSSTFVWLEEVIAANLDLLFPGVKVEAVYPFRVTRDADVEIEEDEAADLLAAIEESVGLREFASVVRLEVGETMPRKVREILTANLDLAPYQVYTMNGPLGLKDLMGLLKVDRPDLRDSPFMHSLSPQLGRSDSIFSVIRREDMVLYHPYDSFGPVVDLLREAAEDPKVIAIKQTLYRVGVNAPVVDALLRARENGKQVAVLVELKARFDEENNIVWAKALERAGVHVVYGLVGLKTHAKVCLIVRREERGLQRYVHMSTGNYNAATARVYTDLGFFTGDADIGADISEFFNSLTGYSQQLKYRKIMVAPGQMREQIIERIEREIRSHERDGGGYLAFKMNQLVDKRSIQALYRASQAGVEIDLMVRGICCLRPGVIGVSENITVTSIVGRFLEHTRMFYFRNGGDEELWIGSADLMPRNLDRRVELLFPVEDVALRKRLVEHVLCKHLADNVKARRLLSSGDYERVARQDGEPTLNSQQWMIEHRGIWHSGFSV